MTTALKHTGNPEIWLRVFQEIMEKDSTLVLNEDTRLSFDGADTGMHPEAHVIGVFKLGCFRYNEFLIVTFTVNGSWDDFSDIKFERGRDIKDLKLPTPQEMEIIRFHDLGIGEVEGGETSGNEWESSRYEGEP